MTRFSTGRGAVVYAVWAIILFGCSITIAACDPQLSKFGPGLDLQLRVSDAQLRRGALGQPQGGPSVSQVLRPQAEAFRGEGSVKLGGRLAPGGVALHLQAVGDPDHWVLPATGFDFVVDDELRFDAVLELSYAIQTPTLVVQLQASDREGRLGPVTETEIVISADVPAALLMVSLGWDAPVDLDLSVGLPDGIVVGEKNINSYEPPAGQTPPPDAWMDGAFLDYDSNQHCDLDLRNRENILWLATPPQSGRYRVYANLFSSCEQTAANAIVSVVLDGEPLAGGGATFYEIDAREQPGIGDPPGLLLLEFEIP